MYLKKWVTKFFIYITKCLLYDFADPFYKTISIKRVCLFKNVIK